MRGGKGLLITEQTIEAPGLPRGLRELPTLTCCHCNTVTVLNPDRTRDRGFCFKCDHYVCDKPICRTECNPFQQSIELALKYLDEKPYLPRGKQGEVLFDTALRDKERIF